MTPEQFQNAKAKAQDKPIPEDLQRVLSHLQAMLKDLPDMMSIELKEEILPEFKARVVLWRNGGAEPDWQGWRDHINDLMHDEGYPRPFPEDDTLRVRQSCSWCGHLNETYPTRRTVCVICEHRCDLPRAQCDCLRCNHRSKQPIQEDAHLDQYIEDLLSHAENWQDD